MVVDWNAVLQTVLTGICSIVVPILVKLLADWVKAKVAETMHGIDEGLWLIIRDAVRIAVLAAEQSGLAGHIAREAEAKKRFACDFAEKYLAQFGIVIDLDVLADMIEAEVLAQFPKLGADDEGDDGAVQSRMVYARS